MDGFGGGQLEPISFEEYEVAYRRFIACLKDTGVEFVERGLDPEHHTFEYGIYGDSDPVTGKIPGDDCYEREFADADMRWQIQQKRSERKEAFDRALRFFADRGIEEFPDGYEESGNIGALMEHALSVQGEQVVSDYSAHEQKFDIRRRVEKLETQPAPQPWTELAHLAVGGLLAIGISEDGRHCLVVSHAGRSVIDLTTGEKVARDRDDGLESFLSKSNTEATGIGPLEGQLLSLAGLWGGGLPVSTPDGWFVFRVTPSNPDERIVLQAPDANIYNSYRGLTQLDAPITEVRAVGFTLGGAALILATSSDLRIWRRPTD